MASRPDSAPAPALDTVPLSPAIGVEIRGVDLSRPIDARTGAAIRHAWAENSMVLLRGQDLSPEAQFRAAALFGETARRSRPPVEKRDYVPDPDNPMHLITNRLDDEGRRLGSLGDGEMWFHTDKCYEEKPHRGSLLYAMELPTTGGHTIFASLYRAHEKIPTALKQRLEGRKVLQAYDFTKDSLADIDDDLDDLLHFWQPLFVTNPDTGRKAVYVCRLMSLRIEGMDAAESRDVLSQLCDIVEAPDNVYEHVWKPGDLIVWDNLSSVHARTDWPRDQPRTLRRCTVQGDVLY